MMVKLIILMIFSLIESSFERGIKQTFLSNRV